MDERHPGPQKHGLTRSHMPAQTFDERCGIHSPQREIALQQALQKMRERALREVRFVWCDIHGTTRSKTLMPDAVEGALRNGVGMVSTLMLKDTSDRTAFKVF